VLWGGVGANAEGEAKRRRKKKNARVVFGPRRPLAASLRNSPSPLLLSTAPSTPSTPHNGVRPVLQGRSGVWVQPWRRSPGLRGCICLAARGEGGGRQREERRRRERAATHPRAGPDFFPCSVSFSTQRPAVVGRPRVTPRARAVVVKAADKAAVSFDCVEWEFGGEGSRAGGERREERRGASRLGVGSGRAALTRVRERGSGLLSRIGPRPPPMLHLPPRWMGAGLSELPAGGVTARLWGSAAWRAARAWHRERWAAAPSSERG